MNTAAQTTGQNQVKVRSAYHNPTTRSVFSI